MRVLSTTIHGVLDYILAIALLAAPVLFGFSEYGGAAVMVPRVMGVAVLLMALMTRYELGVFRIIPMPVHLGADIAAGLLLVASPWLFGFADLPANAWTPHVVVGLLTTGAAMMTQRQPRSVAA
jgi:hypothetical protein